MIKSMTGYGVAKFENEELQVKVEIKTLNGKFAEYNLRLPRILSAKELTVRNILNIQIGRGTIQCNIFWLNKKDSVQASTINQTALNQYINDIQLATQNYSNDLNGLYSQVLTLPEVLIPNDKEINEQDWNIIEKLLLDACNQLNDFRCQEGEKIEEHLNKYIQKIQLLLNKVLEYEPARNINVREKINAQLLKYVAPENIDKNRMEQEMIYYIEKFDITEEKIRLQQHIHYFIETIKAEEDTGKKLGFIAQEILREINTMGSKANHFEIQQLVVEMKDEVEKIKEQVLNIV